MNPSLVVVLPEVHEIPFKVLSISEEGMVKLFTANGSDESFNERLRAGRMRYGLYLVHSKSELRSFRDTLG